MRPDIDLPTDGEIAAANTDETGEALVDCATRFHDAYLSSGSDFRARAHVSSYLEKATELATRASGFNNPNALNLLGNLYSSAEMHERALHYYGLAANTGHYYAIMSLAKAYHDGLGVEPNPELVEIYSICAYLLTYGADDDDFEEVMNAYFEDLQDRNPILSRCILALRYIIADAIEKLDDNGVYFKNILLTNFDALRGFVATYICLTKLYAYFISTEKDAAKADKLERRRHTMFMLEDLSTTMIDNAQAAEIRVKAHLAKAAKFKGKSYVFFKGTEHYLEAITDWKFVLTRALKYNEALPIFTSRAFKITLTHLTATTDRANSILRATATTLCKTFIGDMALRVTTLDRLRSGSAAAGGAGSTLSAGGYTGVPCPSDAGGASTLTARGLAHKPSFRTMTKIPE